MPNNPSDKSVVEHYLREAFATVAHPGDHNIVGEFSGAQPEEEEMITQVFAGKSWQEITNDDLWECGSEYVFLSADAFLYYLPAYLIAYLHSDMDALGEGVVDSLCRPHREGLPLLEQSEYRLSYGKMTAQQCDAVKLFLEYVLQLYPAISQEPEEIEESIQFWAEFANVKKSSEIQ